MKVSYKYYEKNSQDRDILSWEWKTSKESYDYLKDSTVEEEFDLSYLNRR